MYYYLLLLSVITVNAGVHQHVLFGHILIFNHVKYVTPATVIQLYLLEIISHN